MLPIRLLKLRIQMRFRGFVARHFSNGPAQRTLDDPGTCASFTEHYGEFHFDADYSDFAITGLPKESGCIRGEIVKAIQSIPTPLKSVLLPGENNAVKDVYAALLVLPGSKITTAGLSEHVDFQWDFELDPPRMGPFDCIVSQAMLEHLINPYKHVCDLYGLLESGGHLILHTVIPGFAYHRYPVDCVRFFPDWFEEVADRLKACVVGKYITEKRILYHLRRP
jgi:SAM-dependent methyltransferase